MMWGPELSDAPAPRPEVPQARRGFPSEVARPDDRPDVDAATPEAAPAPSSLPSVAPAVVALKAEHKHSFGKECRGSVEITSDEFRYISDDHPLFLSRAEIARVDDSGFEDRNGKKWHFRVEGMNDEEVAALLTNWLAGEDVGPRQ